MLLSFQFFPFFSKDLETFKLLSSRKHCQNVFHPSINTLALNLSLFTHILLHTLWLSIFDDFFAKVHTEQWRLQFQNWLVKSSASIILKAFPTRHTVSQKKIFHKNLSWKINIVNSQNGKGHLSAQRVKILSYWFFSFSSSAAEEGKRFGHFSPENLQSAGMDGYGGPLGNCLQLYQREKKSAGEKKGRQKFSRFHQQIMAAF